MALIHPYDAPIGTVNRRRDKDLNFWKVREKPRKNSEFVFVDSIVRGLPIAQDYGNKDQHLLMNYTDSDLWLRLKEMKGINST